jgi:hypothetical protein
MPKYQMIFDTDAGQKNWTCTIENDEVLDEVETDILDGLRDKGNYLRGWREGNSKVVYRWEGRELDRGIPLRELGVRPNDIIRVSIDLPPLKIRRDGDLEFAVERREGLREGDDIIVGRTILRFHVRRKQKHLNRSHTFIQRMQEGRSFQQIVYFMGLVGAMAGVGCWLVLAFLEFATPLSDGWLDLLIFSLLGAFIGGLTVGYNDNLLGDKVVPRWVLMGILTGMLTGAAGGLLASFLRSAIEARSPLLARALAWMLAGALIGLGVTVRWFASNRFRVLHGLMGGLIGGAVGGIAYWLLSSWIGGDIAQALGFMLTGAGITCGVCLAPILLRQGLLEFVNSQDPAAIKKYAANRKQWDLQEGARYTIGSLSARNTMTRFGPDVEIFIPDQFVAPRHAILSVKEKQYFIEPHPDLLGGER